MKLARVELIIIPIFVFLKYSRPKVLTNTTPEYLQIILYSFPNFFEAIIGTLTLTGVGLLINDKLRKKHQIKSIYLYIVAVLLAGIYVTTQELKLHNLGGNNVYDRNDLIFSFVGLLFGYSIILWIKPQITTATKTNN